MGYSILVSPSLRGIQYPGEPLPKGDPARDTIIGSHEKRGGAQRRPTCPQLRTAGARTYLHMDFFNASLVVNNLGGYCANADQTNDCTNVTYTGEYNTSEPILLYTNVSASLACGRHSPRG